MNIELLKKIAEKAVALPKTSCMATFAFQVEKDKDHPCGAVACICGTAVQLAEPKTFKKLLSGRYSSWFQEGARILDITSHQANRLFDRTNWPWQFYQAYGFESERKSHPVKSAKVLKKRILHFIKTNGAE